MEGKFNSNPEEDKSLVSPASLFFKRLDEILQRIDECEMGIFSGLNPLEIRKINLQSMEEFLEQGFDFIYAKISNEERNKFEKLFKNAKSLLKRAWSVETDQAYPYRTRLVKNQKEFDEARRELKKIKRTINEIREAKGWILPEIKRQEESY